MWIHSIVSPYDIFPGETDQKAYEYRVIQGGVVECVVEGRNIRVNRLISTDPKLYLNPRYCPGHPFPGTLTQ